MKILLLTVHENIHYAVKVLESGAHGYVVKSAAVSGLEYRPCGNPFWSAATAAVAVTAASVATAAASACRLITSSSCRRDGCEGAAVALQKPGKTLAGVLL